MPSSPVNVCMFGTGEYTTGFTGKGAANSDKSTGVVALVLLDLRRRGLVARLGMVGTNGKKLPTIRAHMQCVLGDVYAGIDPGCIETWPSDDVIDPKAYERAVAAFNPGDCAIIFTPDDTHVSIASACLERGMHVMITKPPAKTLEEHNHIANAALKANRLCVVEVHKRFDPIYVDARDRISSLGDFSFFTSYMSQPKHQLETFKAWAGRSSDISYYLNAHHIDFHEWCMQGRARPERVTALASNGVADTLLDGVSTEDTITLAVVWRNRRVGASDTKIAQRLDESERKRRRDQEEGTAVGAKHAAKQWGASFAGGTLGHATYTSSWIAPKADVHSQQRWFYMGTSGEVNVDQAHRGYNMATDSSGFASVNPLFWKPTRDATTGEFSGQRCYGYISFESFVQAAAACNAGERAPADFDGMLPTLATTAGATAILEAGRMSLDSGGQPFNLIFHDDWSSTPSSIGPAQFS